MYECAIIGEPSRKVNRQSVSCFRRMFVILWLVYLDHHFDTCYTDFYRHNSFLHPTRRVRSIARPTVYRLILDRCCREIRVTSKGNIDERVIWRIFPFELCTSPTIHVVILRGTRARYTYTVLLQYKCVYRL